MRTNRFSYPLVPSGENPTCFSCGAEIATSSYSGYALGSGSRVSTCPRCDKATYWDPAPSPTEAHVIVFARGGFRGQAATRVLTLGQATLFTRAEANRHLRSYGEGEATVRRLAEFNLDVCEEVAREAEAGR